MTRLLISVFFLCPLAGCAGAPPCPCPELKPQVVQKAPEPADLAALFDSVVQIKVKVGERMQRGKLEESFEYGTGFFVNDRGLILTSAHVLAATDDAKNITVLHKGRQLQARPVKTYREVDLACLLVDAGQTKPLELSTRAPRLGEQVYAVGFPYVDVFRDSAPAVSVGHVAGADRKILYEDRPVDHLLLTDAFVADGCSGGPLLSEQGEVLGVLRFNLAKDGSWLGLSFAEPIGSYLDRKGAKP